MTFATDVAATSPSAWWRLGESSGSAADASGNGKTATLGGTITRPVTGLVQGDSDTAYNFTGAGQIDTPPFTGAADSGVLGAFIAFKLNATGTEQALVGMGNEANGQRRYSLRVSSANKLVGRVWLSGNSTTFEIVGTTTLTAGVVHTGALTFNGTSFRLLLDGAVEGTMSLGGAAAAYGGALGGLIGSAYNGSLYARANAVLDEVIYWGGAAPSDATITTLSNGVLGAPPTDSGLTLAATIPPIQSAITLASYTDTITANDWQGRVRSGSFIDESVEPVAPLPAGLTRAVRVDKALAYPTPTIIDGRPT